MWGGLSRLWRKDKKSLIKPQPDDPLKEHKPHKVQAKEEEASEETITPSYQLTEIKVAPEEQKPNKP